METIGQALNAGQIQVNSQEFEERRLKVEKARKWRYLEQLLSVATQPDMELYSSFSQESYQNIRVEVQTFLMGLMQDLAEEE
jgi:hypothetical protein